MVIYSIDIIYIYIDYTRAWASYIPELYPDLYFSELYPRIIPFKKTQKIKELVRIVVFVYG